MLSIGITSCDKVSIAQKFKFAIDNFIIDNKIIVQKGKYSGLPVYAMRERVNRYTWKIQYNLDCPQLLWYSKNKEIISFLGALSDARLGEGK